MTILIKFFFFNQLRNVTLNELMQINRGQVEPLVRLRRPLQEFIEHSFPNTTRESLQEEVVDQIITIERPYLQIFDIPQEQASRRVDLPRTFENLLRKLFTEFFKLLFNNGKNIYKL